MAASAGDAVGHAAKAGGGAGAGAAPGDELDTAYVLGLDLHDNALVFCDDELAALAGDSQEGDIPTPPFVGPPPDNAHGYRTGMRFPTRAAGDFHLARAFNRARRRLERARWSPERAQATYKCRCEACTLHVTLTHRLDWQARLANEPRHAEAGFWVLTVESDHSHPCGPIDAPQHGAKARLQNVLRAHMPALVMQDVRDCIRAGESPNPSWLRRRLRDRVFADVGPRVAFQVLENCVQELRGHPVKSYWYLHSWAARMTSTARGGDDDTRVDIRASPVLQLGALPPYAPVLEEDSNPVELDGSSWFEGVFVVPGASRRAWPLMRPFLEVGAAHCNHIHGGNIFTAVGLTASNKSLLIAYGAAGQESGKTWGWFVRLLKSALGLGDGTGVSILSGRDNGLDGVLSEQLPEAAALHCLNHRVRNAESHFGRRNGQLRRAVTAVALATTARQFQHACAQLRDAPRGADVLGYLQTGVVGGQQGRDSPAPPRNRWCAHALDRANFGVFAAHHIEGVSRKLREARNCLPLQCVAHMTTVAAALWRGCRKFYGNLREHGKLLPPTAQLRLDESIGKAAQTALRNVNEQAGTGEAKSKSASQWHHVSIDRQADGTVVPTCSCRVPDVYGMPCSHCVRLAQHLGIQERLLVDQHLTVESSVAALKAAGDIPHVPVQAGDVCPLGTPNVIATGDRRRTRRFRGRCEGAGAGAADTRRALHCGRCGEEGHYAAQCSKAVPGKSALACGFDLLSAVARGHIHAEARAMLTAVVVFAGAPPDW